MTVKLIKMPSFCRSQRVRFVGGEGIIRSYKSESESWTYLVEMPLGLKPDFGRVGAETMVFLNEVDLCAARSSNFSH
ncbi:hypothetical protein [Calothrix sp. PCC 7507]|uniref:hypothetical protein n=1 Tax=Calothrix sp. PCC 7507 TaxID=99598 RepID=UPI00029EDBAF|nr:hypothetical protein [Calothrix sp. PCC 7507]AFY33628.1 hypothetical protein Cal7507_3221 [Calothrix sp. PCC 7507]